jgi:predicted ester cyclase
MITIETQTQIDLEKLRRATTEWGWLAQGSFFAEKHLNHGFEATRESTMAVLQDILTTFPDVRFEPIQTVIHGDWVIEHCWFVGTHRGVAQHPFVHYGLLTGLPASGKTVRVQHTHLYRFENGLIVEHAGVRDDVGMVKQLGLRLEVATNAVRGDSEDPRTRSQIESGSSNSSNSSKGGNHERR